MKHALSIVIALALVAFGLDAAVGAQARAKGGVPEQLTRTDSAAPGHEVVTSIFAWEPNTHTEWHTHPGDMVGHVTEGRIVLEQQGKAPAIYRAGQTFIVPAGVPHDCTNDTGSRTRVFVTYLVEKGKARSAPVR